MSKVYLSLMVLVLALSGCKNDAESAMSEMIDKQKDLIKILKGVTDKDSAVAAKAKIEALSKEVAQLGKKYANKRAKTDDMTKAEAKYKPEMDQLEAEMKVEMTRIGKIPGAIQPIGEALMTLGSSWMDMANGKP
jgi:hypothetical protein